MRCLGAHAAHSRALWAPSGEDETVSKYSAINYEDYCIIFNILYDFQNGALGITGMGGITIIE